MESIRALIHRENRLTWKKLLASLMKSVLGCAPCNVRFSAVSAEVNGPILGIKQSILVEPGWQLFRGVIPSKTLLRVTGAKKNLDLFLRHELFIEISNIGRCNSFVDLDTISWTELYLFWNNRSPSSFKIPTSKLKTRQRSRNS